MSRVGESQRIRAAIQLIIFSELSHTLTGGLSLSIAEKSTERIMAEVLEKET